MNKIAYLFIFTILLFSSCNDDDSNTTDTSIPVVTSESTFTVMSDLDISYANGLSQESTTDIQIEMPQYLDVYFPENNSTNRPVFMFIHGGGFQGGTKTKPEIIDMANYFASRGWVFASVDYRTTSDLQGTNFTGIAPQEWLDFTMANATTTDDARTSVAMYAAQRDAKAALRWLVANSDTYSFNTDYITVGGASAGAITTIALGISNEEDFRDEIPLTDDPTLATTNINETYTVRSMVDYWGGNVKLDLFESVFGAERYDNNDPELFIAHGTLDPTVLYSEATEIDSIYNALGIHSELVPLIDEGHGAWSAKVDGKGLFEMTFDFLVDRQNLQVE